MEGAELQTRPVIQVHTDMDKNILQPPPAAKTSDYDPCLSAKPCSPFYLYNHDSPRPSTDKHKNSFQVSVHDLESGSEVLSPSITQEKKDETTVTKKACSRSGFFKRRRSLRTTPKPKGRLARLSKKQRMVVKGLIAFLIIGTMIGVAVGIAAGLKSGVWRSNNQSRPIGGS